jgi:hypothetical protein
VKFRAFHDFEYIAKHRFAPIDHTLLGAAIEQDFGKVWKHEKQADQHQMGATCFRDARRVNNDRQRPALRINRYMAFATFRFLAAVVPALPFFARS